MNYQITPTFYGRTTSENTWRFFPPKGVNRLYYIHGGKTLLQVGDDVVTPKQGTYYFIPQNLEFIPILEETVAFDHSYVDFLAVPAPFSEHIIEFTPESHPLLSDAARIPLKLVARSYHISRSISVFKLVTSYVNNLMYLLSHEFPIEQHEDHRLITVLEYIAHHYREPITVQTLADLCYMSPNYFIGYFKDKTNHSPYQYIKNYRLEQAFYMLQSEMSVKQISDAVGYENVSSFSTAFKKKYGVYPSEVGK